MDTAAAQPQPIRWHSTSTEIIELPPPKPRDGKIWKTLLQLQKLGRVRVMRDPLGVLRFCVVPTKGAA